MGAACHVWCTRGFTLAWAQAPHQTPRLGARLDMGDPTRIDPTSGPATGSGDPGTLKPATD
eukprot:1182466-Prorocentrum_minimum.AAC.2